MTICKHMKNVPVPEPGALTKGCEECLKIGQSWVHLRKCLVCGQVGCCDSSIGKHATGHYRKTGHEVVRSIELGEDWRYCYVDDTLV